MTLTTASSRLVRNQRPSVELFHEAQHHLGDGLSLYAMGQIDLVHRARIDDLFYAIAHAVRARLDVRDKSHRELLDELNERLVDKYFVNFSVFESIPDVWAIDQVFPIVPIERLDEVPTRRGILADMTCDSDGTVKTYVENEGLDTSMPLHAPRPGESYRIAFFLVGAYQEILGDLHNLFGDTNAVHIRLAGTGYEITDLVHGDTVTEVLNYVQFRASDLLQTFRRKVTQVKHLSRTEANAFIADYVAGLEGYTYLEGEAAQ
jgi:arginine decarboxylase